MATLLDGTAGRTPPSSQSPTAQRWSGPRYPAVFRSCPLRSVIRCSSPQLVHCLLPQPPPSLLLPLRLQMFTQGPQAGISEPYRLWPLLHRNQASWQSLLSLPLGSVTASFSALLWSPHLSSTFQTAGQRQLSNLQI